MNDVVTSSQTDTLVSTHALAMTAGALLRQARESAGLHVAALAVLMKIPVKKLEALEADRYDLLLDAVFVRALASSVCRALKIDSSPILDKLPKSSVTLLGSAENAINTPFHAYGHSSGSSIRGFFARPSVLIVCALLLGVLVLVLFPYLQSSSRSRDGDQISVAVDPTAADVAKSDGVVESVSAIVAIQVPQSLGTGGSLVAASSVVANPSVPVSVTATVPTAASPLGRVDGGSTTTSGTTNAGPSSIVFKAKGPTWIEVVDAKGIVQLRKTLVGGDVATASGTLPLSVVIGRVDALEVEVNGKPFSLASIVKDNVARFEVK